MNGISVMKELRACVKKFLEPVPLLVEEMISNKCGDLLVIAVQPEAASWSYSKIYL